MASLNLLIQKEGWLTENLIKMPKKKRYHPWKCQKVLLT